MTMKGHSKRDERKLQGENSFGSTAHGGDSITDEEEKRFWEGLAGHELTYEDIREIRHNLTAYFNHLAKLDAKYKLTPTARRKQLEADVEKDGETSENP